MREQIDTKAQRAPERNRDSAGLEGVTPGPPSLEDAEAPLGEALEIVGTMRAKLVGSPAAPAAFGPGLADYFTLLVADREN